MSKKHQCYSTCLLYTKTSMLDFVCTISTLQFSHHRHIGTSLYLMMRCLKNFSPSWASLFPFVRLEFSGAGKRKRKCLAQTTQKVLILCTMHCSVEARSTRCIFLVAPYQMLGKNGTTQWTCQFSLFDDVLQRYTAHSRCLKRNLFSGATLDELKHGIKTWSRRRWATQECDATKRRGEVVKTKELVRSRELIKSRTVMRVFWIKRDIVQSNNLSKFSWACIWWPPKLLLKPLHT